VGTDEDEKEARRCMSPRRPTFAKNKGAKVGHPALWNQALQDVPWFSAVPQDLFIFIGVCEFLGGVGLILPVMTGVKPRCRTGKA